MNLSVRPLTDDGWSNALGVMHRAFVDEAFTIDMYGSDIVGRWGGSWGLYASLKSSDYALAWAGHLDALVVGVVLGSPAGRCHLCHGLSAEPRPVDEQLAVEWEFNQNIAQAHSGLGPHAWVAKVAVEPALHGRGIGRDLLEATAQNVGVATATPLVLECAPDRISFYAGLGFEQIGTFADPTGPDASLMGRWV